MSNKRKRHGTIEMRVHRRTEPGSAPGMIIPDPHEPQSEVQVFSYCKSDLVESKMPSFDQLAKLVATNEVTWINVDGLGNTKLIERLGEHFNLHRLALEDVVNVHQRSKVDTYGDVMFIVLRMPHLPDETTGGRVTTEQVSIFAGTNFVITFQEGRPGDCFDRVRLRLREGATRLRGAGAGYLVHALLDGVIDNYYPVLEVYAERLDRLEENVIEAQGRVMDELHEVKADLLILRRAIWPLRETVASLSRDDSPLFGEASRPYLRDCYDHVVQIVDLVETYRELTADLRDLHMSSLSNRTNDIMRVLTIISTIFMPLTFIAGIYGMNFHTSASPLNMPELDWEYGYLICLGVMSAIAAGQMYYFYYRGWILPSFRPKP